MDMVVGFLILDEDIPALPHQSSPHPSSFFFFTPASFVLLVVFFIALVPILLGLLAAGTGSSDAPKLSQKSFLSGSIFLPPVRADSDDVAALS